MHSMKNQIKKNAVSLCTAALLLISQTSMVAFAAQGQTENSIIPGINETGVRGDMARRMMAKSEYKFLKADMNHNYLISVEEAGQHLMHISNNFSRYDKNKDGSISWHELLGHDKWPAPVHKDSNP